MQEVLEPLPTGYGGRRKGAGRKPADYEPPADEASYNKWRARSERAKALNSELELKIKSGEYVERAAVVQAVATAYSSIAQTLRSIPDHLERRLGIDPTLAEEIGRQIDDSLSNLATEFEMMGGGDE